MSKPRIVVLGGSFNPPTKAHQILMETAMDYLHAEQGIYVPSSDFYVKRKVDRNPDAHLFNEWSRLCMLMEMTGAMSKPGRTITVGDYEYGDKSKGRTLQTLCDIQAAFDKYDVWFIMGCDKIDVFHKWPTNRKILSKFYILWVGRDSVNGKETINNSPLLSQFKDRQLTMEAPAAADGISSSEFWRRFSVSKESAYELLPDAVSENTKASWFNIS